MSWRLGLVDVCAILVWLVILIMPPASMYVKGAYDQRSTGDKARDIPKELARASQLQFALLADPGNGVLTEELSAIYSDLDRHDMALRLASESAQHIHATTWRSLASVASAYAERVNIPQSLTWTQKSLSSCEASTSCAPSDRLRLSLILQELQNAVALLATGADPRHSPTAFRRALTQQRPSIHTP